jgi:hypothetical protein
MRFALLVFYLATTLAISACSSVTVQIPLIASASTQEERNRLSGSWLGSENESVIHVAFPDEKIGKLARVDWQDGAFRLVEGEWHLTEVGERKILSARMQEKGKWPDFYFFAEYIFSEPDYLVIWPPKVSTFEQAVADEQLAGAITRSKYETHVQLTGRSKQLMDFLAGSAGLFDHQKPIILRRITRIEPKPPNRSD